MNVKHERKTLTKALNSGKLVWKSPNTNNSINLKKKSKFCVVSKFNIYTAHLFLKHQVSF